MSNLACRILGSSQATTAQTIANAEGNNLCVYKTATNEYFVYPEIATKYASGNSFGAQVNLTQATVDGTLPVVPVNKHMFPR